MLFFLTLESYFLKNIILLKRKYKSKVQFEFLKRSNKNINFFDQTFGNQKQISKSIDLLLKKHLPDIVFFIW